MNVVDRNRKFREAQEQLVHAIVVSTRTGHGDPLAFVYMLVHRTSAEMFRMCVRQGGKQTEDGFALRVVERSHAPDDPMAGISADRIACMISIDGWHKALGLPLDVLGVTEGGVT